MPIRREHRHLYRGPEYRARRERIREREGDACKFCRVPNGKLVGRYKSHPGCCYGVEDGVEYMAGVGKTGRHRSHRSGVPDRVAKIVCTLAHLDHDPTNNAEENLAFLCQWCHLHHDQGQHQANARATRTLRKDAARPLLWANVASDRVGAGTP